MKRSISPPPAQNDTDRPHLTREYESLKLTSNQSALVEKLVQQHNWYDRRTVPVRRFLENLVRWVAYHDEVRRDPVQFTHWSRSYSGYALNRKRGLYPLPIAVLRKWNGQPKTIMAWLTELRVLSIDRDYHVGNPDSESWHTKQGVCRYYHVNLEIESAETRSAIAVLRELRKLGISNRVIGEQLDVKPNAVAQWFSGARLMKRGHLPLLEELKSTVNSVDSVKRL